MALMLPIQLLTKFRGKTTGMSRTRVTINDYCMYLAVTVLPTESRPYYRFLSSMTKVQQSDVISSFLLMLNQSENISGMHAGASSAQKAEAGGWLGGEQYWALLMK